jgi:hypothetical protein
VLASVSGSITAFVGDHGVYAVFLLMAIDAVFPAASELVMVYAGALASGAFASQDVPGLTLPNSAEAHQAMQSMGMDDGSMGGGSTDSGSMGGQGGDEMKSPMPR